MQGRGSAANSVVCYVLGITAIDPVGMELLFERFLSEERGEWPDIDLDLPSGDQRERAIQYVYQRYGELGAAMTANVITYRGRSAAREAGKALGFDPETLDRLTKLVGAWEWKGPGRNAGTQVSRRRFRHPPSPHRQVLGNLRTYAGHSAPSRATLRRHGDLRGTTECGCSHRTSVNAGPHSHPVGQGRLCRHEDHQS